MKYQITILNRSIADDGFATAVVEADRLESEDGCHKFYNTDGLIAVYPIDRTIIEIPAVRDGTP